MVHRLDKDTSGLLLIAKNSMIADFLTQAFKDKTIHKTYIALVFGNIKKIIEHEIDRFLGFFDLFGGIEAVGKTAAVAGTGDDGTHVFDIA